MPSCAVGGQPFIVTFLTDSFFAASSVVDAIVVVGIVDGIAVEVGVTFASVLSCGGSNVDISGGWMVEVFRTLFGMSILTTPPVSGANPAKATVNTQNSAKFMVDASLKFNAKFSKIFANYH